MRLPSSRSVSFKDGRGKSRQAFPLHTAIPPLLWWIQHIPWSKPGNSTTQGATYIELTLHFFLCTGATPGYVSLPLSIQAKLMAQLMKAVATQSKISVNGKVTSYNEVFPSRQLSTIQAITQRAAVGGVARRPCWSQDERTDIGAHLLMAKNIDGLSDPGTQYCMTRHGLRRTWQQDHMAEAMDTIAARHSPMDDEPCGPVQPLTTSSTKNKRPRPTGPCVNGHITTTVSGQGNALWYCLAEIPHDSQVQLGDIVCHKCYLSTRAAIRGGWRRRPHGSVDVGIS